MRRLLLATERHDARDVAGSFHLDGLTVHLLLEGQGQVSESQRCGPQGHAVLVIERKSVRTDLLPVFGAEEGNGVSDGAVVDGSAKQVVKPSMMSCETGTCQWLPS
jgi:hypothetical protein